MKGYAIRPASGKSADFLSGILFLLIGAFFSIYAYSYPLGSSARLGPGAFPFYVGILLSVIGLVLILKSWASTGEAIQAFNIKSLGLITLSLVLGAATLTSLGVIVAVPITVVIASLAARHPRVLPIIAMALLLTAFTYLVFVVALGIQLPLFPGAR
ncbi:tripartite tricarboxylate transporter TctB family protein [Chelatococcus asaccharovorans]|uniref:tripartite tricarboxylate transporter TctB family protein n=1 Tax=Chelatococcus asaccharovorans TaxID=28210 RepID=UPI00224C729D|nr:tripartite tricarboxylate transporter TctB family protein [Chelatococcus asaccharovorans]CAH1658770.1 Tripartite tricarboxylate transporter TctB family protein [Chelatococcus asaccharovorans]CAH1688402.1 Tripartite tricarboxylate transporter TctB family protein [Chelatococcus asaccharovorans]